MNWQYDGKAIIPFILTLYSLIVVVNLGIVVEKKAKKNTKIENSCPCKTNLCNMEAYCIYRSLSICKKKTPEFRQTNGISPQHKSIAEAVTSAEA